MRILGLYQRGIMLMLAACAGIVAPPAAAQAPSVPTRAAFSPPAPRAPVPEVSLPSPAVPSSVASPPFPVTWRDARWLGAFTAAAVVTMLADDDLQRVTQRRWVQESSVLSYGADAFNAWGSPGVIAGSAVMYAAGWAGGRPELARLGMRTGEAIVLSGVVTGGIKGVAGRARPFASPGAPRDFRLMKGVHDGARQSFPSGHTTAAFAFASAMHHELRHTQSARARWVVPALYTAAALTGLSRMHADKHWASDVVMGAGVGMVSGAVIARFHADRPGHWLDRLFLPPTR